MKILSRDKVALKVATAGTVAVGGLAFSLSFTALSELSAANGVAQSWMVPLVIDGGILVATMATVALSRHGWYAWALLILSSLMSVAGNVAHAQPHGLIAMVIAAIPPLWLLASTHLTVLLYREAQESGSESISEPLLTRGFAEAA
ncbi:hypothetical protein SEA_LAKES_38 [Mycobacterium phage Lakes]|uniref:Gene 34.1 protein n=7 Tax=root TaxID=1 RepID=VG341_BPMD2|nr:excisionase [Mycobacterium phage D29]O64228.1 RecName: Full=Gene 34.1 protein; AltName: Full=Gp34.1 [Fromanvirus D29]AGK85799.1 hypothetical protein Chy1_0032 [Mycobacterium phage Chy1]QFG08802.1 hypothetical protein SEA_NAJI_38 [Mycobacterium phage Naji]QJD52421.1 hypothetical protein PBI_D32_38 [Mycobacterium phage D32]QUE25991.1 hypothetical protein SEA_LAKES_38 [Mycobacterium phage Lakes]AAC18475.1 hypothetical protein PBI_D29_34.1 [Mycobacterium phage D29]